MDPDAPRHEVVERLRGLSSLIESRLPRRVDGSDVLLPWETTAPLLLARIASQGRTLALLTEHSRELDAQMVLRSLLEHLTLFAWLAIEPQDQSRDWLARDPASNTLWWMQAQYRREKKLSQDQHVAFGGILDERMRSALRAMKERTKTLEWRGAFPEVLAMAEEVDAHWAPRLPGWVVAEPQTPAYVITFRGHYWALYTAGSASVHPDYGAIRRFLRPPRRSGYQRHYLVPEELTESRVNVLVSVSAFLIGDALAVADAALGWMAYDDALRLLDRWDEVRAPDLLLAGIEMALRWSGSRVFGRSPTHAVMVQRHEDEDVVVTVDDAGAWRRLSHVTGTRRWGLATSEDAQAIWDADEHAAEPHFDLGNEIMRCVEVLAEVDWTTSTAEAPDGWPEYIGPATPSAADEPAPKPDVD